MFVVSFRSLAFTATSFDVVYSDSFRFVGGAFQSQCFQPQGPRAWARPPDGRVKATCHEVPPLRCKGPDVLLVSVARVDVDGTLLPPSLPHPGDRAFRMLSDTDRLLCQGYPVSLATANTFSKTHLKRACGNAYALPAVASVMIPILSVMSSATVASSSSSVPSEAKVCSPPAKRLRSQSTVGSP